jgi:hypothetical protein
MNDALSTMLIVFEVTENMKGVVEGALTSSPFFGGLIGAIVSKIFVKYSLRMNIISLDIIFIFGGFLLIVDNIYVFLLGRFFVGMASGFNTVYVAIYLK